MEERKLDDNLRVRVESYNLEIGNHEVVSKSDDIRKCFGGILLVNRDQNIVVKNTLDVRVDLCYQDSLPDLREILFPE
jgi:V-type H+-transporting ATPase subunit E